MLTVWKNSVHAWFVYHSKGVSGPYNNEREAWDAVRREGFE